ncbi:MAG TPA: DUF115 domain-containing protein [Candidatus Syntrophoarchaeum butanivorans]|uniref:6-hydroxymethyl-7,8-dihydropterin pyrophosphokinase n=1 Tax=Candidatus Syntropharchaeum butanivorans TaxID=1839936 RepID=A0A1F2P5U6_9EURY|nr:MAG: protein containing DUF115 [Candidatus Syntrophoarchaeum butanivorans]HDM35760.1 DUF115 domain-containing protein [Candidatus Syntrophoarchaeum butanivorans]HEC57913.1 DUF115 domain-containing protein [Candidatus Syntrophoarchaeum butanivorans]
MDYMEWEPIYREILEDFGFVREENERAARILAEVIKGREIDLKELEGIIRGRNVLICGDAPTLQEELRSITASDFKIIAADGATSTILREGMIPDVIVTDLDGSLGDIIYANRMGSLVVVLGHGDNIDAVRKVVPNLSRVLGTTHGPPFGSIYNFGGFTDGDRAVFLAKELGASQITLVGFDFEDKTVDERKQRKLRWAKRLIDQLLSERRRG